MKDPFYKSLGYAINGIKTCIQKERNIKIHLFVMGCVIVCGFLLKISIIQWMICLLLFALVIALELVNTAIEAVVDLCSPTYHPLAKKMCIRDRKNRCYFHINHMFNFCVL